VTRIVQEIKAMIKSPGGWFFASNAVLYTQTHPLIALVFLLSLVGQRLAHHKLAVEHRGGFWGLIVGPQGILAVNSLMTLASALVTSMVGTYVLALSGFAFGGANLVQSILYTHPALLAGGRRRHLVLVCCEFAIAFGLAWIAVNAGYSVFLAFGLVIPVVIAGFIRTFRPHWLPSGFAYADMMFLTIMTGYEASLTGNVANAASRLLVLFGLSRLAVLRAHNEGKTSVFEVERFFKR